MQEALVRFLGQDDPLEKEMATHSSILVWRIPWIEELDRLQSMGSKESSTAETTEHSTAHITFTEKYKYQFSSVQSLSHV